MYNDRKLSKLVLVSDPEMWYNQNRVEVKLFICPECNGNTDVRILVKSIDDFMMEYTRTCYNSWQSDIDSTYQIMKEHMFDTMPKVISYKWLLQHGYFPF